jgi:hypothetical protein
MTTEMHDVFRGVWAHVLLVETFQDGDQSVDGLTLCDSRNLVQWHLLSLLPGSQLGPLLIQFCPLYEPCRLALMIFGIGVIFPLPPDIAPLARLARTMQVELQGLAQSTDSEYASSMQRCWCLVLGGIVAAPEEKEWFVHELRGLLAVQGVSTWDQLKRLLRSILWWESACDAAGQQLWFEVNNIAMVY